MDGQRGNEERKRNEEKRESRKQNRLSKTVSSQKAIHLELQKIKMFEIRVFSLVIIAVSHMMAFWSMTDHMLEGSPKSLLHGSCCQNATAAHCSSSSLMQLGLTASSNNITFPALDFICCTHHDLYMHRIHC